jgi:Dehydrogenases with different specificities (related to short-chain alcohol dehydrogenases)
MKGKVCLITGASSGIGKATSIELAKLGATVAIVCRTEEKCEKTAKEIIEKTKNENIIPFVADLLSQKQIRNLAEEVNSKLNRLDVLINNAGSYFPKCTLTEDGIESTFALNYLAPFLLTNLLLNKLIESRPSRIINVSSSAHFSAKTIDFDSVFCKGKYNGYKAYAQSKLALTIFTYELSRKLKDKGVTVNCMHPGAVRTSLWSKTGAIKPLAILASFFMRSPEKGAETIVYLASSEDVANITGKYFFDKREEKSSAVSYDVELAKHLWEFSERLTNTKYVI